MADYGLWGGLERATGRAAATGLNIAEFMQNRSAQNERLRMESERLGIAREQAQIQNAANRLTLEQAQRQRAAMEKRIDITTHPALLSMPEQMRPEVVKFFAGNGYTDEAGRGKVGDILQGVKAIESSAPIFKTFMEPVVQAKKAAVIASWGELQAAQQTGDPKKVQAAQAKFDGLNASYQASAGKFDEHLKTLMEFENKKELERVKAGAKKATISHVDLGDKVEIYENGKLVRTEKKGAGPNSAGKPPTGYRFNADGGLEAIPGGPADTKLQAAQSADAASLDNLNSELDRLEKEANAIMTSPGLGRITGIMGKIPNVPGSAAADTEARLNTLKSQVSFSVLQAMRNASKTGGALGQVSDRENQMLQENLASLDKAQSEPAIRDALKRIIDYSRGSKARIQKAYDMRWNKKEEPKADPLGIR